MLPLDIFETNRSYDAFNETDGEFVAESDVVMQTALIGIYAAIFLAGLLSNAFILAFVAASAAKRTVTNVFVANLASADILMCLFSVPFTPFNFVVESWPLGLALCKLIPMSCGMSVFVISWTSTLVAVERYFAVVRPSMQRPEPRHALVASAGIWLVSAVVMTPIALHQDLFEQPNGGLACRENWGDGDRGLVYTCACLALQYVVPSFIMGFAYARVLYVLGRRMRSTTSKILVNQRERQMAKLRQTHRITVVLVVMIVSFMLCWIPLNAFNLTLYFNYDGVISFSHSTAVFFVCHAVASSSTIINAVLYVGCNQDFKLFLRERFHFCPALRSLHPVGRTSADAHFRRR